MGAKHKQDFFIGNDEMLSMLDRSISMETQWFQHMKDVGCQQKLQEMVIATFTPATVKSWLDPAQVHHRLEGAKAGDVYRFGTDEAKGVVNITAEWAKAVAGERAPNFKGVRDNTFLASVQIQMESCLQYQSAPAPGSSGDAPVVLLVAGAALTAHYTKLELDLKSNTAISLGSLKIFDTFSWMMTESQLGVHKRAVAFCFAKPKATGGFPNPAGEVGSKQVKREAVITGSTASLFKPKKAKK